MSRPVRSTIFWLLLAALAACHLIVAVQSLVAMRFWEDEAFNLTVVVNLLAGNGYTSDGALSGSTLTPFDPRISTGPAVLLPAAAIVATGVDPVVGARIIPLLYWGLLLAGLWVLGHRIAGRWAALLTVAVPLAFNTIDSPSPIQGPADFLGEIPAAALLVWALVILPQRAWLAGLLVGLAIQAKLIALLALPAFAIALWVLAPGKGLDRIRTTLRRAWLPLGMVALPSLLFEIAALLSLGWTGYVQHLRALRLFVLSGGQNGERTTIVQKLTTLADSWFVWPWLAALVAVLSVALIIGGVVVTRRTAGRPLVPTRPSAAVVVAAAVGLATFVLWWATAAHLPLWTRHPAPGVFAFAPILAAAAVWGGRMLWGRAPSSATDSSDTPAPAAAPTPASPTPASPSIVLRSAVAATIAVVAGTVAVGGAVHAASALTPRWETLQSQRAAVAPLRDWVQSTGTTWLAADPWGSAVAPIVLTGAHLGLSDAPAMAGVPRLTGGECATETLVDGGIYRICEAPTP